MSKRGGGSKSGGRKKGRNLVWCAKYRSYQTREKNKAIKIARHLRRHPEDRVSLTAMAKLPSTFTKKARAAYGLSR